MNKNEWVHISEITEKTKEYIRARRDGTILSMRTGYPKLDAACIDGFEWGSTITLGGRPSIGKTAVSSKIIQGALLHNDYPFEVLDFNWEMAATVLMIREISASMKKSYKYILSADNNNLSPQELQDIEELLDGHFKNLPIHYVEQPQTAKRFAEIVRRFVDTVKKPVLVRVDHTILAKQSPSESSQVAMLLNLMGEANNIKREMPVIFMFLTQMLRDFEDRQEDGTLQAFPRQSDVYGGDAAAQYSETMILLNKPAKYGIEAYGEAGKIQMFPKTHTLYAHIVKNRNAGSDTILAYEEDFATMNLKEL
jgi:replicative DNA helicase